MIDSLLKDKTKRNHTSPLVLLIKTYKVKCAFFAHKKSVRRCCTEGCEQSRVSHVTKQGLFVQFRKALLGILNKKAPVDRNQCRSNVPAMFDIA